MESYGRGDRSANSCKSERVEIGMVTGRGDSWLLCLDRTHYFEIVPGASICVRRLQGRPSVNYVHPHTRTYPHFGKKVSCMVVEDRSVGLHFDATWRRGVVVGRLLRQSSVVERARSTHVETLR